MHMLINSLTAVTDLDAQAVRESVRLVTYVTAADLARPTPCADWTLHGLLRHMIAQHHGFAAASAGDGDSARWRSRPLGDDAVSDYRAAADRVLAAFAADGVAGREFPLPEFGPGLTFPAAQAISFHFIDYVVHSWDVARALGVPARFSPDLLDAALAVAQAVPAGDARTAPGAAFAPPVAWSGGTRLDQIVAVMEHREAFVTAQFIDIPNGDEDAEPRIVCCGHPPPLVLRDRGATFLDAIPAAPPLGLLDLTGRTCPRPVPLLLLPGETALFYTDGVTEARDGAGAVYPLPARAAAIAAELALEPGIGELPGRLAADLLAHAQGDLRDDATLMCLRLADDADGADEVQLLTVICGRPFA